MLRILIAFMLAATIFGILAPVFYITARRWTTWGADRKQARRQTALWYAGCVLGVTVGVALAMAMAG